MPIGKAARPPQRSNCSRAFYRSHHVFRQRITLGVIGLVTALVLAFQRRWSLLLGWAVALIGAGELNVILKASSGLFARRKILVVSACGVVGRMYVYKWLGNK
jgi:hypothetical protein